MSGADQVHQAADQKERIPETVCPAAAAKRTFPELWKRMYIVFNAGENTKLKMNLFTL